VTDCLTDLKRRFQRFVDGQNTFEELKLAANLVAANCSDRDVVDFLSNAHRNGLLSDNHYRSLIDDISVVRKQSDNSRSNLSSQSNGADNSAKGLTVLNDRFVVGPVIGRGGMGVVYKARDLRKTEVNDKDDIVAIKVLSSELRDLPKYLVALQREAKKAQILAHPNIVTVYDFDRDGDIAYMTMEYLDGVPLNTVIHAHAPLPKKKAIRLIQQIAHGLAYAHKHKIVHSDLKPSNIFLLRNGTIKILDFGIARAFHTQEEATGHTIINDTQIFNAFTPAYASCEIINNIPPTPKDDIYALGCIAHELLTQTHPYARVVADKAKEKKLTVKRSKFLASHEHRAIAHAVELNKSKRVESVNEFVHELTNPITLSSLLSNHPVKTLGLAFIVLVVVGGIYATNKLTTDKTESTQQTVNVDKIEISNILKQANNHMKSGEPGIQGKNDALALYHQVLKLDPNNPQAISGIEDLKELYIQQIENSFDSNDLTHASELLKTLEGYFSEQIEIQHLRESLERHLASNQIELLVKQAHQEEAEDLYVRPAEKNAHKTYREILELSPGEPRAIQGIERIRKHLVTEAETMAYDGQWEEAETTIKDALLISPGSQDAVAVLNTIKMQRLSETNDYIEEDNPHLRTENLSYSQQRLIQLHTNLAKKFIDQDKPYGQGNNNAAYHFRQILTIDPNNKYALSGLNSAWITMLDNINFNIELSNYSVALEIIEESTKHFFPFYDTKEVISKLSAKRSKYLTKSNRIHDVSMRLTQAKVQLKADHLISPKGNNALESYLEVKNIDPGNKEATSGLARVENKLSSLIKSYIDKKQSTKARGLLRKAIVVFPKSKKLYDLKLFLAKSNHPAIHNSHMNNPATGTSHRLESAKQITKLSNDAIIALNRKRYIFPVGRSAYDLYSKITSLDPGNSIGVKGRKEAKLRAYAQIDADISDKNYQIAHLRINRLSNLGVRDERLDSLQTSLQNVDKSYSKTASNQSTPVNHLIYLLKFARSQENNGVIWPPQSDNAYGVYKHVHDIEPLNKTARESLSKLFNSRISSIKSLLDSNRLHEAESELQALDKLYGGKKEKEMISKSTEELKALKIIYTQQQKKREKRL
jgi:serine/threonine protein kinase